MSKKIIRILEAGECSEVIVGEKSGRIMVNRPAQHDFERYPISADEDSECFLCRLDREERLIVTVEGLGFAETYSVLADDGVMLVSFSERVVMEVIEEDKVRVEIEPR